MSILKYPFSFQEDLFNQMTGMLELDEPFSYPTNTQENGFCRHGRIRLEDGKGMDLVLYHNQATTKFMYMRDWRVEKHLLEIIGADSALAEENEMVRFPGQLCLGPKRTKMIGQALDVMLMAPVFASTFEKYGQENFAVFPIAREGLKYQVNDAIFDNYGFYCDEIVLDAHHVFDSSVPVYNRAVELTLFKDKDLDQHQKENIAVAFFADSIASGLVMKEVILRVEERFEHLKQVEVIAPLATIRGLCRLVESNFPQEIQVRVHVFETLLNALPPDYYYSAHFNEAGFHFEPGMESEYRDWWGEDEAGNAIADTACAGYGWSEVFYSPRKQIQMMNSQLMARHNLSIADIVTRNLTKK